MTPLFSRVLPLSAMLFFAGAGCLPGNRSDIPETASQDGTSSGTGMTIVTPPKEEPVAPSIPVPVRWDLDRVSSGVSFTPPKGYWVTTINELQMYYIIPGKAPEPGSDDPRVSVVPTAVASFTELQNDPKSFPNWERFELTMAQFGCASGSTDDDFVVCGDTPTKISTGKTAGGFAYRKFALPLVQQRNGKTIGSRTFISVRFQDDGDAGILVSVLDERRGATPALELVKSMKR